MKKVPHSLPREYYTAYLQCAMSTLDKHQNRPLNLKSQVNIFPSGKGKYHFRFQKAFKQQFKSLDCAYTPD